MTTKTAHENDLNTTLQSVTILKQEAAEMTDIDLAITETETSEIRTRVHASALVPAGTRLVVKDEILHVANLTFWSNQMGVNLAEGKTAHFVTEQGKIKAAFNILSDWRLGKETACVHDQDGMFQLKYGWTSLTTMPDNANVGVVNANYVGEFAGEIVGFENAKATALKNAKNAAQQLAASRCWFRLGISSGQLKIEKRLVNLDAAPDENDEITHMRRQIMRASVTADLLKSERTGVPLLFKWDNYQFGYVAAWYIGQFLKPAKAAYEDARSHQVSAQIYKKEARFRIGMSETPEGVVPHKTIVSTNNGSATKIDAPLGTGNTFVPLRDGGEVDLRTIIGKQLAEWIGSMPYSGPVVRVLEANAEDLAAFIHRNGMKVDIL